MSRARSALPILLALVLASTVHSHPPEERPIHRLGWLAGRWENVRPRLVMEESWLPPVGNTMLGVSRVVKGDSLVAHEVVIIREVGSRLAYEAHPSGQAPATFLSVTWNDSTVIFENLAHDFPQRIGYQRIGADSLYAWIEGPVRGSTKRNEFPYSRAPLSR
jgi:hypothetical protein